jgi:hypothetical protein
MAIKLSSLSPNTMIECNGQITTVENVISKIKQGNVVDNLYLVDDNFITTVLSKAHEDHVNGKETGFISAPNNGEKVINDICNYCGCVLQDGKYKPYLTGQKACVKCWKNKEYQITCLAMAIINNTNDTAGVSVEERQLTNDANFDFAVEKIKDFLSR